VRKLAVNALNYCIFHSNNAVLARIKVKLKLLHF